MLKFIFGIIMLGCFAHCGLTQENSVDYRRVRIGGNHKHLVCGLDITPDGKYLAVSCVQDFPLAIFDWEKEQLVGEYNVGNWYAGSSVKFSRDGKYVLLNQLYYIDFAINKDREVNFEVIESATGKVIKRFDAYHAVSFTPDSKFAVSLTGEEVAFWDLSSGKKKKSFHVQKASNGLAISPDGRTIAISHKFSEKELKNQPRYKKDKKALKHAMKYKQKISVYDASTFEYKYTVAEYYDIVYKLEYSSDGNTLFCLQIPHLKAQTLAASRQTYIATINGKTGEPSRKGFTSQADYEPDFKLSHDGKLFGVVSKGARFLELHIYDFETGRMVRRFEQSYRLFEKNDGGMIVADSRTSFVFLPGDKTIVMTMGNHLIYWNLNL